MMTFRAGVGGGVTGRLLAAMLSLSLTLGAADIPTTALEIPNGSAVKLKLKCGETHEVRLVRVEERGIVVQALAGGVERPVEFGEIVTMRPAKQGLHPGWVALITVGGVILYALAASAVARR